VIIGVRLADAALTGEGECYGVFGQHLLSATAMVLSAGEWRGTVIA
jgi:hypothetical protein